MIAHARHSPVRPRAALSLIFERGGRPCAGDILRIAADRDAAAQGFAISHRPEPSAGWLELLATGLTFDLGGLAPAALAPLPPMAHRYGFAGGPPCTGPIEAITLVPGEQLSGAENLLPVVRVLAGIAARLADLAGVRAVVWHPARSVIEPRTYIAAIADWSNGGPFPALGLTALYRSDDGAVCSEGLAFFTGQELRVEPHPDEDTLVNLRIASRLINQLVGIDAIHHGSEFKGPNGEQLSVEPPGRDGFVRVWRKTG